MLDRAANDVVERFLSYVASLMMLRMPPKKDISPNCVIHGRKEGRVHAMTDCIKDRLDLRKFYSVFISALQLQR